jgi:hypothetical protein
VPSTFTGLVLFVLLLAPGFAFLLVSERGVVAVRQTTPLRQTATIGLASVVWDIAAVLVLAAAVRFTPLRGPNLDNLMAEGLDYARRSYRSSAGWLIALVVVACVLSVLFAGVLNRTDRLAVLRDRAPISWLFPESGGTEHVSAWWKVLVDPNVHEGMRRYATCYLEDGSSIRGWVASASPDVRDSPDRELVLWAPLVFIDWSGKRTELEKGAATVSSGRMLFLHVRYLPRDAPPPALES